MASHAKHSIKWQNQEDTRYYIPTTLHLYALCKLKTSTWYLDDSYHDTVSRKKGINMQQVTVHWLTKLIRQIT